MRLRPHSTTNKTDMPTPQSIDDIRNEMRSVRNTLASDVDQLVQDTQSLTDWRQYVHSKPLVAFAATALVGYLLIPKKTPALNIDSEQLAKLVKDQKLVVAVSSELKQKSGLLSGVMGLAVSLAMKSVVGFAAEQLNSMMVGQSSSPNLSNPSHDYSAERRG